MIICYTSSIQRKMSQYLYHYGREASFNRDVEFLLKNSLKMKVLHELS